ncbi:phosphoribosylformylglycinamidine synthase [Candidatus Nomurabacteria bacterium RIFCSPHIGHO2_02_FULL_41_18]|uniref:Phosphoribosylformylglycinamidine synthase subunit PurL n=1 Tax=Candidatus Nomurabacteria bacterium RIFCSPHIGHO2_02_FULL_41_18 TaxID=1801754 RepID=A0A1F6W6Q2_9BACT|nr:MAG: phosphoribosylformylglycinamidine synthase [Candidatus Nomurabacteria bacterium RIFCSPHIGHO2_01_FULL_41_71]OGI77579.1 MAG: phosphoribosylformylglycinamidine synthase [Candidatus Nomurabacteria bacterium RIFCSPHIGHO2_02_FULL_41_18]OGI89079.1 MAG: phosphoribosylformylglycinamidine synthase [Candidatus Nomurabacteria bacterium RIFCSPLOWO2_01_FULL_41_52b]
MISRIYVTEKGKVNFLYSYLLSHNFSREEILKIASALTNPILEEFSIDKFPDVGHPTSFTYAIEIGFKPGVTDNIAHTVKETIGDLLHLKENSFAVYTSKIYLIYKKIDRTGAEKIAFSLHNPLIERANIFNAKEIKKTKSLPDDVPEVFLKKSDLVIKIPLGLEDMELEKIGREGIMDDTNTRRGPLALDLPSMKAIRSYFSKKNRDPNDIEIEALAQTWSEHCKHTIFANPIDDIKDGLYKTYIKGATNEIRKKKGRNDFCVSVFSDNAGGIIFDKNYLITHKVETHNSPSALDPFGGAITGIVGVNRDTIGFGLGAKPVANTYGFCFGNPNDKKEYFKDKNLKQKMLLPKRIMEGVIKGINVGGNCSGIPTLSGFIKFDDRYRAKPMVFAGTVGLLPRKIGKKLLHEKKAETGGYIVVVGGRVGLDGIHGATFSSVAIDSNSPTSAVQIGDPITQKKLSDAIVKEARDMNLYNSITDNGAGGLSCSVAEMAKECGGAKVFLEKVPLKYPGLRPWEIWISESQERMTLSVPKKKWKRFYNLMQSRGVEAAVIGEFTNSGKVIVKYKGKVIMDIDMEFLHNGLPKHHLTTQPIIRTHLEPKILKHGSLTGILEKLLGKNNLRGFSFISEQYDHEVQASSVLKPLSGRGRINTDAQVFRPVLSSNRGVVLSEALYPSYSDINTYHMAACALDTAVRNAICAGGTMSHLALLDNFCWYSSNDPTRLAELKDAVKACYDYAVGYGTPFISGKDSMFNDFKGYDSKGDPVAISIPPTLLISAIGVMPDFYKAVSPEFKNTGDVIYLLGETYDELGGSEYYKMFGFVGNNVPKVNLEKNLKTYLALEKAIKKELIASAISVASGGLGITLAKACIGGMLGCNVSFAKVAKCCQSKALATSTEVKLFSESQGRILVSVSPKNIKQFEKTCIGVSYANYAKLGEVSRDGKVIITEGRNKIVETSVKKLHDIYHRFSKNI